MQVAELQRREINGGQVAGDSVSGLELRLPVTRSGYANAQLDDYAGRQRRHYPWRPGVNLQLRARFSHQAGDLIGTAGFGFWNAPFADPGAGPGGATLWPAVPQATWFFYASAPTDLPLAPSGPGRGWFASTLDATRWPALALAPLAPVILLLNQWPALRRRLWPSVQRQLGISYRSLPHELTGWHGYELDWQPDGCRFLVDGELWLSTPFRPRGPLGFVCWLDNQYLVARPDGRFRWGTLAVDRPQAMEIADLALT